MNTPSRLFNPQTNRPSSNFVALTTSSSPASHNKYIPKYTPKTEENLFKSNFLTRYSSQEELQSYARPKVTVQNFDNSPKNYHHHMHKKTCFLPTRKSNTAEQKGVSNFIPAQIKKRPNELKVQDNNKFFKSVTQQQRQNKQLKQTSSTNSTDNMMTGVRSQKSIPTFLKATSRQKRNSQQNNQLKTKEMVSSFIFKQNSLDIDSFQIIDKLGEGKFASVFLAVQKSSGFIVALKIVDKKRIISQNFLTQFIRQLKIQAYLDHPNIAKIYGFFQDQNYFYSILELGEGGQLYDIIKNGHTLSEQSTSFIIGNLLDAINYIHDKKILHRDIKPQNIVLVHGNVKLCDFGWAVYKKKQLRSTFCGTPLYLSPELLNGEKYDEKVDLWALGVLAFQLHLGSSPFNIESQEDLLKIITNQIQYPQDSHVSKNFKQFIGSVLKKDPKERLQAKKLKQLKFIKRYRELQTCQELCQ